MTEEDQRMANIEPIKLSLDGKFRFECHKDVPCFTQCCRGINITLTPYDIIMLKNRLQLPSDEFLAIYTEPQILEKTDLPVVTLKLLDDAQNSCPFVRDGEGCIVYEDRPTTCRYYPLGVASLSHKEGADDEGGFFFFVNEPHCKGFDEEKEWTVRDWRKDQGVDRCDEINAGWTDLLVRKRSFPSNVQLTERSKQLFFMICYNIDAFRRFVFESEFLKRHHIPAERVDRIRNDEIELLIFGLEWLRDKLFNYRNFEADYEKESVDLAKSR